MKVVGHKRIALHQVIEARDAGAFTGMLDDQAALGYEFVSALPARLGMAYSAVLRKYVTEAVYAPEE